MVLNAKKSVLHNGRRLLYSVDYTKDGEQACREVGIGRTQNKTKYRVWHHDYLEKFFDIPQDHFIYEFFEFDEFEQAVTFVEEALGIPLEKLK